MLARSGKTDVALYDREIQALSVERLRELRAARVERLLARVGAAANLRWPRPTPSRLDSFPILRGDDFAAEVEAHPPFGRFVVSAEPLIRAGLATAAVPRPVPIAWSRADLDREASLGARALARAGLRARSRTSDTLDGGLVTPGTLAVSDALDTLDTLALPVGPIVTEAALERAREVWEIVQPRALIVDERTLSFLERQGHGGFFIALLSATDAARLVAPPRPEICRILCVPQVCTFAAGECEARTGYHLAEDAVAAEIVDAAGAPIPDGRAGRLLLTPLERSLSPMRFDSGIRARIERDPCTCGETHARLVCEEQH